jgi:hypothetical protein
MFDFFARISLIIPPINIDLRMSLWGKRNSSNKLVNTSAIALDPACNKLTMENKQINKMPAPFEQSPNENKNKRT